MARQAVAAEALAHGRRAGGRGEQAVAGHAKRGGARGQRPRRRWLRDRRIRTKLSIILALPVLAIVALTGLFVVSAAGRAIDAGQARDLVAVGGTSARLVAALQRERAAAALVFAEGTSASAVADYQRWSAATDGLIATFAVERSRIRLPDSVGALLSRIDRELAGLAGLRQEVAAAPDAVLSVVAFRYRAVIADLISYRQALGQVGVAASTANGLRSAAALSQAMESLSRLQVAAVRAIAGGRLTPAGQQEIVAADTGAAEALQAFTALGAPSWRARLNSRISGGAQIVAAERLQSLVTRAQPGVRLDLGTDARGWSAAIWARIELMHAVESELDAELLAAVTAERDAQWRTIVAAAGAVAVFLLMVLVLGGVVARSMTGSLSRLTASATDVAARRLPAMVASLDVERPDPAKVEALVAAAAQPITIDGRDEVGQVAAAFNSIIASAVRIAGAQAILRAAVAAMLVSVSRRVQERTDAVIVKLDRLERDEQDPDRLQWLFELDHQIALTRRLIANLQILAGGRGGRPRPGTEPLIDVIRAAAQQINDYQRIQIGDVDPGVRVVGNVVDELTHLLGELFDNAARFSPPASPVHTDARRVGDLLHIQIRDTGTGMTDAQLHTARDRIANPRRLDESTTQHMGLPVVGAIAQQLGARVEFRSNWQHGTIVDLTVPAALLVHQTAHEPTREPTRELVAVAAETRSAPPAWSLPHTGPHATVEPVIFERLTRDPNRSWFQASTSDGEQADPSEPAPVGGPPGWPTATATTVATGDAMQISQSGLPVRQPGAQAFPAAQPVAQPPIPPPRAPERVAQQMAAFQRGLNLAGRRIVHHAAEGNR